MSESNTLAPPGRSWMTNLPRAAARGTLDGMEPLYVPAGHMTARQVADALGIGLPGVRKLVARGHLARAGGSERQPYYDTETVLAILDTRKAA